MIEIDTKSLRKLNKDLDRIGRELNEAANELPGAFNTILTVFGNKIRNTIINSMRNTKRAPWSYTKGRTKVRHNPSYPGHPPAVDTGELLRSIMFDVDNMQLEVGTAGGTKMKKGGESYALFLETGTFNMAARPWLEPAVNQHADDLIKRIGVVGFDLCKEPFDRFKK